jgi:hypothetical protein
MITNKDYEQFKERFTEDDGVYLDFKVKAIVPGSSIAGPANGEVVFDYFKVHLIGSDVAVDCKQN